jgi:tRNA(Ile)-lysidine synthetase-like protein
LPPRNDRATAADDARLPVTPDEADLLFKSLARFRHVAIAVSGGSDSVALMALARAWSQRRGGPELTALTVDHRLRPASAAEAVEVAGWAGRMGLTHHTLVWDGLKPDHGIQEAARQARYGLLVHWCRANGADAVALAHTLEDQAETVLMRLARGSGVDGLSGMSAVSQLEGVALLRPLLAIRKARLQATLEALDQPWIEDPSNRDERFERVRVRRALGVLEELGVTAEAIGRSAGRLGSARAALDEAAARAMDRRQRSSAGVWCPCPARSAFAGGRGDVLDAGRVRDPPPAQPGADLQGVRAACAIAGRGRPGGQPDLGRPVPDLGGRRPAGEPGGPGSRCRRLAAGRGGGSAPANGSGLSRPLARLGVERRSAGQRSPS